MVTATSFSPLTPGGSFLVLNSGWLYRVPPRLVRAFPGLDLLWPVWLFVGQGLLCQVFWASLSYCSTRSFFVDTLPSFEIILLLFCPSNPGWLSVDRRWHLPRKPLFLCWWLLPRLVLLLLCRRCVWTTSLLSKSSRWSCMPIGHLEIPLAIRLLPLPVKLWWSSTVFDSSLPLAYTCPIEENWFLIPSPKQKLLKSWLLNWHLLFDIIVFGISNLQTMFLYTKLWIFASVVVGNASASTYFVK